MKACFIGHRNIDKTEQLCLLLKQTIEMLIKKGVSVFLFGSKSAFDNLSWEIVTKVREKHPFIKRVNVRASFQNVSRSYEKYLYQFYEETYFPNKLQKAGKISYVERNFEMIDKSNYCIFYYNQNYEPPLRLQNKGKRTLKTKSGTKLAYEYAVKKKKKKKTINLYRQ